MVRMTAAARAAVAAAVCAFASGACRAADEAAKTPGALSGGPGLGALIAQVAVSLAIVLGLVWVVALVGRSLFSRSAQGGQGTKRVVEVLARQALGPKRMVELIRVGGRVILVGSDQAGMTALAEFRDRGEVERLVAETREAAAKIPSFGGVLRRAMSRGQDAA